MSSTISSTTVPSQASDLLKHHLDSKLCLEIDAVTKRFPTLGPPHEYVVRLVDGRTITFDGIACLMSQTRARAVVADAIGFLLPRFKPDEWDSVVQVILDCGNLSAREGGAR